MSPSHIAEGRVPSPGACIEDRQSIAAKNPFRRGSVLRVRPFGLNPERMAAKITEGRNRTLFPTDEAVGPTRPRRTMSPPGKPSPHASVSGSASESVSKTLSCLRVPPSCPKLTSRRDAEPAEVRLPFHHRFPRCTRSHCSTRNQRSGVGKQGGSYPSTVAGSGPADIPIHPDHSKWNCSSNAMAGRSGPSTDCYGRRPLTR